MPKVVAEKSDWIKLGFQLFSMDGESGLIVDHMVKQLKCNRSSFYWHFKTKKAFIHELVSYWMDFDTDQLIALTQQPGTPKEQFQLLVKEVFKADPLIDFVFYIKRYALKDQAVQKSIDEIDQRRIAYTTSLLAQLGYTEKEAAIKAQVFYKYLIGYHEMIRYKKQPDNYLDEVNDELRQFIII